MGKRKTAIRKKQIEEDKAIYRALKVLDSRIKTKGMDITNPSDIKDYLRLRLEGLEQEVFAALFLDTRHRIIEYEVLFYGTIDSCSVHPREVVKATLKHNAAAVIFAHNHPSGIATPSQADQHITEKLKKILGLLEIRVLDHFVIGDDEQVSFAERGLL